MAQQLTKSLLCDIDAIQYKLRFYMTEGQKDDWRRILYKRLDALDALYRPVDQWGRSEAQQKEDAENPCRCHHPTPCDYNNTCCATCGLFYHRSNQCDRCVGSVSCEDNEEYWEPRTWQTCRDCGIYVCGLKNHQKTCENFIWNELHCKRCGNIYAYVSRSTPTEARCSC
jgi:hypothetical protein